MAAHMPTARTAAATRILSHMRAGQGGQEEVGARRPGCSVVGREGRWCTQVEEACCIAVENSCLIERAPASTWIGLPWEYGLRLYR